MSDPIQDVAVIAGNRQEYKHWIRQQPEELRERSFYVCSLNDLRGVRLVAVRTLGTLDERKDWPEVEDVAVSRIISHPT